MGGVVIGLPGGITPGGEGPGGPVPFFLHDSAQVSDSVSASLSGGVSPLTVLAREIYYEEVFEGVG